MGKKFEWEFFLSLFLSFFVCLFIYLFIYLSIFLFFLYFLFVCLFLSFFLSFFPSLLLYIFLFLPAGRLQNSPYFGDSPKNACIQTKGLRLGRDCGSARLARFSRDNSRHSLASSDLQNKTDCIALYPAGDYNCIKCKYRSEFACQAYLSYPCKRDT